MMLWLKETAKPQRCGNHCLCGLCENAKRGQCKTAVMNGQTAADPHIRPIFAHTLKKPALAGKHAFNTIMLHSYPSSGKKELYSKEKARAAQSGCVIGPRQGETEYLLQGKAYCGKCGAPMVGENRKSEEGMHHDYTCQAKENTHTCRKSDENKDFTEWYVVGQIMEYILTPARIELLAEAIANFDEKEMRADTAHMSGKAALAEAQENDPAVRLSRLQIVDGIRGDKKEIAAWLTRFCAGDPMDAEFRRRIIDTFVDSVYLYDDRIVIFCNLKKSRQLLCMQACELRKERTAENTQHPKSGKLLSVSRISPNARPMPAPIVSKLRSRPFALQFSYAA